MDVVDQLMRWGPMNEVAQRAIGEIDRLRRELKERTNAQSLRNPPVPTASSLDETHNLEDARFAIGAIDRQIASLLEFRVKFVHRAYQYKVSGGDACATARDAARETEVKALYVTEMPSFLPCDAESVAAVIIEACVDAAIKLRGAENPRKSSDFIPALFR